jgi:hypothetical protein
MPRSGQGLYVAMTVAVRAFADTLTSIGAAGPPLMWLEVDLAMVPAYVRPASTPLALVIPALATPATSASNKTTAAATAANPGWRFTHDRRPGSPGSIIT